MNKFKRKCVFFRSTNGASSYDFIIKWDRNGNIKYYETKHAGYFRQFPTTIGWIDFLITQERILHPEKIIIDQYDYLRAQLYGLGKFGGDDSNNT